FGVNGHLVGRSLRDFVEDRKRDMPRYQYDAFFSEQARLAKEASPNDPIVLARIPMVFKGGQYGGRAFLPIIVNYQQVGDVQQVRVIYRDVNSTAQWTYDGVNQRSCYVCSLNPDCRPLKVQSDEENDDRTDRVFLAYNSIDRDRVRQVAQLLSRHGFET